MFQNISRDEIESQNDEIKVNKKDYDTEDGIYGAEFTLYAEKDIKNYKGQVVVKAGEKIENRI